MYRTKQTAKQNSKHWQTRPRSSTWRVHAVQLKSNHWINLPSYYKQQRNLNIYFNMGQHYDAPTYLFTINRCNMSCTCTHESQNTFQKKQINYRRLPQLQVTKIGCAQCTMLTHQQESLFVRNLSLIFHKEDVSEDLRQWPSNSKFYRHSNIVPSWPSIELHNYCNCTNDRCTNWPTT